MNDTQRLDAFESYGLFLTQHSELAAGVWSHRWVCRFDIDKEVESGSLREVIDLAVATIQGGEHAVEEGLQQEDHQQEHCQREGVGQAN